MPSSISKVFLMILPAILKSLSPILLASFRPLLEQLRATALSTQNPWDDIFVEFLDQLLAGILTESDSEGS